MTETAHQENKGGFAKAFGIGCLVVILIIGIGGFFAFRAVKGFVSKITTEYTASEAARLPSIQGTDAEASEVLKRIDDFSTALKANRQAAPLELTSRDINILIQKHQNWKELAGKAYVNIEGDKINGEISIPLEKLGDMFKGRYLNGSAVFRVEMAAGRLMVFIDSLNVRGKTPPEEFMKPMRAENLAKDVNKDPEATALLDKLESLTVRNGVIRIVPKKTQ